MLTSTWAIIAAFRIVDGSRAVSWCDATACVNEERKKFLQHSNRRFRSNLATPTGTDSIVKDQLLLERSYMKSSSAAIRKNWARLATIELERYI